MPTVQTSRARTAALAAAGGLLLAGGIAGLAPRPGTASSHREAPLISGQPQYDNTDVYAFVSPDKPDTTTLVANFIPFQDPAGGPNFYKFARDARYDLNIDNDGDSLPDLTYRFQFHDRVNYSARKGPGLPVGSFGRCSRSRLPATVGRSRVASTDLRAVRGWVGAC